MEDTCCKKPGMMVTNCPHDCHFWKEEVTMNPTHQSWETIWDEQHLDESNPALKTSEDIKAFIRTIEKEAERKGWMAGSECGVVGCKGGAEYCQSHKDLYQD